MNLVDLANQFGNTRQQLHLAVVGRGVDQSQKLALVDLTVQSSPVGSQYPQLSALDKNSVPG